MRLTAKEVDAIKASAREAFGQDAVVRLFGSRVDDRLEGGDVDLHIEADARADADDRLWKLRGSLWANLQYDKIDIILSPRGHTPRGFERVAYRDGII